MKTTIKDLKNLIANLPDDTPIYDYAPNGCLYQKDSIEYTFGTKILEESDIYPSLLRGESTIHTFNKNDLGKEVFYINCE